MIGIFTLLVLVVCAQALSYEDYLVAEWEAFKLKYEEKLAVKSEESLLQGEWKEFKLDHGKTYSTEAEEEFRLEVFKNNKRIIDDHNKRWAAGEESYEMGLNEFSDLLPEEFKRYMLGFVNTTTWESEAEEGITYIPAAHVTLPGAVDWRGAGAVTSVKNQRACGSCWAFAATGVLEGQHFRKTHQLILLSEQNLVDCSTNRYHNKGCNGGMADRALQYVQDNGGIDTEGSYPYRAANGQCQFNKNNIGATVRSVVHLERGNEGILANAVATVGPIAVSIDASHLQSYRGGVYNDPKCSRNINHAVLIVGYGNDPRGGDFWLVKNSWGIGFGEQGYIRMSRNRNNQCGIADWGVYPLV
ncbi:cathepsin L-like [Scaptodrosophila lebanonensis]|uniref:cathepsin L n=1 Tax=Drosophila lebanonensis TaxID=7225 RepID=A0A6J2T9I7_DROLE|nr:cathepsin L-like [Scaptodrosophila lebanonensis]